MSNLKKNIDVRHNWRWRLARLTGVMAGAVLVTVAAAEKASGDPVSWTDFPGLMGPAVVLGLIVQGVSALLTGSPSEKK